MRNIGLMVLLAMTMSCKNGAETEKKEELQEEKSPEIRKSISEGAAIYNNFCASCHLSNGEGIAGVFPPLKNSNWLTEKRKESIRAVKHGIKGPIEVNGVKYDNLMPSLGLTDEETADVMNYIFSAWGNNVTPPVTTEEVAAITE